MYVISYSTMGDVMLCNVADTCLASINKALNEPTCNWSKTTCSLNEPPTTFVFTFILAGLTVVIAVPLQLLYEYIIDEYASKRPNFIGWGITTSVWFGTTTRTTLDDIDGKHSPLAMVFSSIERSLKGQEKGESVNSEVTCEVIVKASRSPASRHVDEDYLAYQYVDLAAPAEEVEVLLRRLHAYLSNTCNEGYLPWRDMNEESIVDHHMKVRAISHRLGIHRDGTVLPLTLRKRIVYGNASNYLSSLIRKCRLC